MEQKGGYMKKHDYFYGSQSEQFQFFMVPQVFFTESVYSDLDCDVIILYSIMLRRIGLSRRNGWIDSLNRVYIRYSQKEARKDIRRGKDKVLEAYKVLERHDLIERIDMGVGKPDLIYVKNFVAEDDTDEDEYASDTLGTVPDDSDNQTQDTPCDSELPIRDVDNSAPDAGFQMPWGRKIRLDRDGNSDLKDKILNKHNSDIDNSYPFISCITAGTVGKELPERTNKQNLNQNLSNKSVGGDISNYIQIIQNNIRYPEVMETLSLSDAETYEDIRLRSDRFPTREAAETALAGCTGHEIRVTSVDQKEVCSAPPKLFDLTALQREANKMFGFTAKQTLDYLQSLYEKKLATYPRTDSRYLTDDMESSAGNLLSIVKSFTGMGDDKPDIKRILNSSRVSDHHAVIITPEVVRAKQDELPDSERKILELIMLRMAEATATGSIAIKTEIQFECAGSIFKTSYEEPIQKGFKAYTEQFKQTHGISKQEKDPPKRHFKQGDTIPPTGWTGSVKEDVTKPAQHFTESTLLNAMEKAGTNETSKDAERKGLGTPATRADIIEKLIHDGYVKRTGKKLEATDEGIKLITIIPDRLKSPSYTAEWENRLAEIANGTTSPHIFMECIETEVRQMAGQYSEVRDNPGKETYARDNK